MFVECLHVQKFILPQEKKYLMMLVYWQLITIADHSWIDVVFSIIGASIFFFMMRKLSELSD